MTANNPFNAWQPLTGIVPPLATPLLGRDELDRVGLERLVEHVIAGGVSGIFILGSTGEAPSLSYRLRREFISAVLNQVARRVRVLVGITDTSFIESIGIAEHSAEAGADAVVLSTPYYFPAGQTELIRYVDHIVAQLPLPLILYNMPSLTKVWFEIPTVEKLMQHEHIVGAKDSGGDIEYYAQLTALKKKREDWSVLIGPEAQLLKSLKLGGDGGVAGGANIYPRLFVDCYDAWKRGDETVAEDKIRKIEQLQAIYDVGKYASRFIKATKCALSLNQICSDHMAEPFNHFLPPERERVRQILIQCDLLSE